MSSLLDHLGKDTLPQPLLEAFVHWCIWEQACPALALVLEKVHLDELAADVGAAQDIATLLAVSERAGNSAHEARTTTGPLGMSAAEAAAFEVANLARAADSDWDPESVAFFSARVCGWAGWAESEFTQPAKKTNAESAARQAQEQQLKTLWQQFATRDSGSSTQAR